MKKKNDYIKYAKDNMTGKALDLALESIDLFYNDSIDRCITKYSKGDKVLLKKGYLIHGVVGTNNLKEDLKIFDELATEGLISNNFKGRKQVRLHNIVGVWNIKEDVLLKDYIIKTSGVTIRYRVGNYNEKLTDHYELIPYGKTDKYIEKYNNDSTIWQWMAEQTKEIRFIPTPAANINQVAFIINTDSKYAKKVVKYDVWSKKYRDEEILKYYCNHYLLDEIFNGKITPLTTDREGAIIFGINNKLIEGILVGRKFESNSKILKHIKTVLPDCYICNIDGKVIIGNK